MNIYDFDGTIYDGDSSIDFFKYSLKRNKKIILDIMPILFSIGLYLIKIVEKEKMKSSFFRFVKRIPTQEYVQDFWTENEYKIKNFYKKKHKSNDIVISASPEFLLNPIAQKYGFKLIATDVDIKTGKLRGRNCYGDEKVKRLKMEKMQKCECFYSDSLSDLPCASLANKAFIVKKDIIIPWNDYHESKLSKLKKLFISRDFITFLFIGVINAFNGVWISYVYSLFADAVLAYILGFFTSLIIAYILNSLLNFKTKLSFLKLGKFAVSNIPNFIIQVLSVVLLLNYWHWPKLFAYMLSTVIAVPITFVLIRINVFVKKNNPTKSPK